MASSVQDVVIHPVYHPALQICSSHGCCVKFELVEFDRFVVCDDWLQVAELYILLPVDYIFPKAGPPPVVYLLDRGVLWSVGVVEQQWYDVLVDTPYGTV